MKNDLGLLIFYFTPGDIEGSGGSLLRSIPTPTSKEVFMKVYEQAAGNKVREVKVCISHWMVTNSDWRDTVRYWVPIFDELNIQVHSDNYIIGFFIEECRKLNQLNALGD